MTKPRSKLNEVQLDKEQRIKKTEENKPTIIVSEYHLIKSGISGNNVRTKDLIKPLEQKGHQHEITKKLQYVGQKCRVSKPLKKSATERIKQKIRNKNEQELNKSNAVITKNGTAKHLSFPLNHSAKMKDSPTMELLQRFRFKSKLTKKLEKNPSVQFPPVEKKENKYIYEVVHNAMADIVAKRNNAAKLRALQEKDDNQYKTAMADMIATRKNVARLRALQSYKEARAHRLRKIKSKKFHRIQKKGENKHQLEQFEKLQKTNPTEFLLKLDQLDKNRAEERMSLRHKSTGQWAKNKQIKAKYDKDTRQVLAEQLAISRELTQKIKRIDSSDEEDEVPLLLKEDSNSYKKDKNPWLLKKNNIDEEEVSSHLKDNVNKSEVEEFIESYRKYWDHHGHQKHQEEKEKKILNINTELNSERKCILLEKQNSDDSSKGDNSSNQKAGESENKEEDTNLADQKTEGVKIKKEKKNTRCAIISNKILKTKVKLCKKVNASQTNINTKRKKNNDTCGTSEWNIEIQSNEETKDKHCNKKSKISKLQSIDEMFDLLEDNLQHKADLKLQKDKKKLEINSKKKQKMKKLGQKKNEEENKNNEDLEFKHVKSNPILNQPLHKTIITENIQEDNLPNLLQLTKTIANTKEQKLVKSNNRKAIINVDEFAHTKRKYIMTQIPDVTGEGEDELDNSEQEEEMDNEMYEAFGGNDVEEQFRKEKEEEIKNSQPEILNSRLPGWGSWVGPNMKQGKRYRRKKQIGILRSQRGTT